MGFSRAPKSNPILYNVSCIAVFAFIIITVILLKPWNIHKQEEKFMLRSIENSPEIRILSSALNAGQRNTKCNYFNCFDVYKCGHSQDKLSVYIYPIYKYEDGKGVPVSVSHSREFVEILQTIYDSPYYVSDPSKACIFIPSLDLLNQNLVRLKETSQILANLPYWNSGINHLLFNMLPGSVPDYNAVLEIDSDQAMIAGAGFSSWTYRRTFDISIPTFSLINHPFDINSCKEASRRWLASSAQINIHFEYRHELEDLAEEHPELLVLGRCSEDASSQNATSRCRGGDTYEYPAILEDSTFCIIIRGARLGQTALSEALKAGCIPVVVADGYIMPFAEVIDWKRASITLFEENLGDLVHILKSVSDEKITEMRRQACFLWQKYFSSMKQITTATLDILQSRIFPHSSKTYEDWNDPPSKLGASAPLFLPAIAPKSQGFTAVILTYDRLESLFQVIQKVVQAPSLAKVLVVWNNQVKSPPPASAWPKISKPLKVVQTKENRLSNRFYPYDEIETEAVLAIDDDIVMLTADELEFGYEVWREFPDRIVGFPSRVHLWDNTTKKWKYESEWTNEISMVLTGAAYYHKYYSYLYTNSMPGDIKEWVDDHMNCEDIAMNFLVANVTGKAPIKVTPRKKFKCPECTNVEMLSADVIHMAERTECINRFAQSYGLMTLKTVEFRADPVLYKDNFPEKLKRFNNVGSL
ncbi:exostosin-2 [Parasteatoda tepidariorum]|nr:exostosin-2 [Parasteatoda tepidariorum]